MMRERTGASFRGRARRVVLGLALVAACGAAWAEAPAESRVEMPVGVALWPSFGWPSPETDILGLRFGVLAARHANVSLLDIDTLAAFTDGQQLGLQIAGVYTRIGEGAGVLQLGGLASDCRGDFIGGQISAFYNRIGGTGSGASLALLNVSGGFCGLQIGLINRVKELEGLQIGLVNYAEDAEGLQIGLINVMRDGKYPVCPLINIGY